MIKDKSNVLYQKEYSIILSIIIFFPQINYYFNIIIQSGLSISTNIITPFFYSIVILTSLLAYVSVCTMSIKASFVVISAFAIYLSSFLLFPNNREFMFTDVYNPIYNPFFRSFVYAFPLLLITFQLFDYKILYSFFYRFSVINLSLAIISFVFHTTAYVERIEYMTFSYNMLFSLIIIIFNALYKKKYFSYILSATGVLVFILIGARGAIITLSSFFFFYVILFKKNRLTYKVIIKFMIMVLLVVIISIYFELILNILIDFGINLGINTRSLVLIRENIFLESQGRTQIFDILVTGLRDSPIKGYGLWGDRYVTLTYGFRVGTYAHNILLEIIIQFGIIFGSLILACLFILLYKQIKNNDETFYYIILLCVIPNGFIKLFFSGSYLTEPFFFFMVGLLINRNKIMYKPFTSQVMNPIFVSSEN